eukprot:2632776-Prymnesium_polylepis.1
MAFTRRKSNSHTQDYFGQHPGGQGKIAMAHQISSSIQVDARTCQIDVPDESVSIMESKFDPAQGDHSLPGQLTPGGERSDAGRRRNLCAKRRIH